MVRASSMENGIWLDAIRPCAATETVVVIVCNLNLLAAGRLGSAAFFWRRWWGLGCGLGWLRGRFDGSGQEVANGAGRNDRSSANFGRLDTALGDLSVERSSSNAHQTGGGINAVTEFFGLIV
jgi:hypothetical protein